MTAATPTDLARLARLFHALSDETRLGIVQRLRAGERCVCELTDLLDAAQSRLSFHLKVLRDVGLVHDRRDGRWVYYSICPETFALVEGALEGLEPTAETAAHAVGAAGCCR
jgi:ArsR family transcriptional regulator